MNKALFLCLIVCIAQRTYSMQAVFEQSKNDSSPILLEDPGAAPAPPSGMYPQIHLPPAYPIEEAPKQQSTKKAKVHSNGYQKLEDTIDEKIADEDFNPRASEKKKQPKESLKKTNFVKKQDNSQFVHKKAKLDIPKHVALTSNALLISIISSNHTQRNDKKCVRKLAARINRHIALLTEQLPDISKEALTTWFVNQPIDDKGSTLAHRAAWNHDLELLKFAHSAGVDIFKRNKLGIDPETCAAIEIASESSMSEEHKSSLIKDLKQESRKNISPSKKPRKKKPSSSSSQAPTANPAPVYIIQKAPSVKAQHDLQKLNSKAQTLKDKKAQQKTKDCQAILEFFQKNKPAQ